MSVKLKNKFRSSACFAIVIFFLVCGFLVTYGSAARRLYLGMSKGKATVPSAAEMLSTMEVRARMFPCSGESATLKRSAKRPNHMFRIYMRGALHAV